MVDQKYNVINSFIKIILVLHANSKIKIKLDET